MQSFPLLASSAFLIALTHTLLGPDHYLPFIALARARSWSAARTSIITLLCGAGHVASSVILGLVGLYLCGWRGLRPGECIRRLQRVNKKETRAYMG